MDIIYSKKVTTEILELSKKYNGFNDLHYPLIKVIVTYPRRCDADMRQCNDCVIYIRENTRRTYNLSSHTLRIVYCIEKKKDIEYIRILAVKMSLFFEKKE